MSLKFHAVLALFVALVSRGIYQNNPVFFGKLNESYAFYDHIVYDHYPHLDDELFPLAFSIGQDLGSYRNHCLRVLTFTRYFLPYSIEENLPNAMDLAATAIAYLRIGLWTGDNLNYVESSKEEMVNALEGSFAAEEMEIMMQIILQQHKIRDYAGLNSETANSLVNAVRKASWADATMGLIRFDLPASLLESAYDEIQGAEFHKLIWGRIVNLSPDIMSGVMDVVMVVTW
mmetsp:Transcript_10925/g.23144  ORF Transcript_10925/g.23144 Transcript_10925/m.23144 type:complete len:231 (+) Transcript_10925:84-776(+)